MKRFLMLFVFLSCAIFVSAQYVEPEKAEKEAALRKATQVVTMPTTKFDSIQAKNMLTEGTGKIVGVAFTRQRNGYGMKILGKVKANKIKVVLFPVTPYFEEFYKLWKDKTKNNPKKNRFVYMSEEAMRYRLEAITNSDGEFTFPKMRPGRYYLYGNLSYAVNYNYNKYAGTAYDDFGGVDIYTPSTYTKGFSDFLEAFVEVKSDGEVVQVKLK